MKALYYKLGEAPRWRRWLLRLALGKRTYEYMCHSILADRRCVNARSTDIVVRKDGREKRIEADWVKTLYRLIWTFEDAQKAEEILSLSEGLHGDSAYAKPGKILEVKNS